MLKTFTAVKAMVSDHPSTLVPHNPIIFPTVRHDVNRDHDIWRRVVPLKNITDVNTIHLHLAIDITKGNTTRFLPEVDNAAKILSAGALWSA
jgi:hypothetical protein